MPRILKEHLMARVTDINRALNGRLVLRLVSSGTIRHVIYCVEAVWPLREGAQGTINWVRYSPTLRAGLLDEWLEAYMKGLLIGKAAPKSQWGYRGEPSSMPARERLG